MPESIKALEFVAGHYGFITLFGLISYLIGRRLTSRVAYDSLWEEVSVSTSLGLGVIASLTLFLGLLGLLYRSVVVLVLAAFVALSYETAVQLIRRLQTDKGPGFSKKTLLLVVSPAVAVPVLVLPLYPPTQFDATMYFLATSKIFAARHAVVLTPYLRMPVLTQLNEMFFTLGLLFYDDIAAQLFQLLMLIMLTCAIIAFGQRSFSKQAGWWAAALWLANPAALWCGSVAYVDISLALFATMAGYSFWNWANLKKEHWLILSGMFCGFAAGTKYPGLFFVLLFGLLTLYTAFRTRKFSSLLRFGVPVAITAGPWYVRNFYYTHNPVFPFLQQLFRSTYWSVEDVQGLVANMKLYGVGHSPSALLELPWSLTFHPDLFFPEGFYLPRVYLFGLPIVAMFAIKDERIRKILGYLVLYMLFWVFSAQILRYLLPALPILSVVTAASIDLLFASVPLTKKLRTNSIVIIIIFGLLFSGGWLYARNVWQVNGPIPVSQPERDSFLSARLPSFPAHKLLDGTQRGSYTLYAMQDENLAYFVNGTYKGDYFGPARYSRIWDKLSSGQALYNELKSMDADYFLVNQARMKIKLPQDDFFRRHFKSFYERGDVQLFELTDSTFPEPGVRNALQNPQ